MGTAGWSVSGGSGRTRKFASRGSRRRGNFCGIRLCANRDDVRTSVTSNRLRGVWLERFWQRFPVCQRRSSRTMCSNIIQCSGPINRFRRDSDHHVEAIWFISTPAPLRHIGYLAVTVSGKISNGGIRAGFRSPRTTCQSRYLGRGSRPVRTRPR